MKRVIYDLKMHQKSVLAAGVCKDPLETYSTPRPQWDKREEHVGRKGLKMEGLERKGTGLGEKGRWKFEPLVQNPAHANDSRLSSVSLFFVLN